MPTSCEKMIKMRQTRKKVVMFLHGLMIFIFHRSKKYNDLYNSNACYQTAAISSIDISLDSILASILASSLEMKLSYIMPSFLSTTSYCFMFSLDLHNLGYITRSFFNLSSICTARKSSKSPFQTSFLSSKNIS
jgi:hypothetical protein